MFEIISNSHDNLREYVILNIFPNWFDFIICDLLPFFENFCGLFGFSAEQNPFEITNILHSAIKILAEQKTQYTIALSVRDYIKSQYRIGLIPYRTYEEYVSGIVPEVERPKPEPEPEPEPSKVVWNSPQEVLNFVIDMFLDHFDLLVKKTQNEDMQEQVGYMQEQVTDMQKQHLTDEFLCLDWYQRFRKILSKSNQVPERYAKFNHLDMAIMNRIFYLVSCIIFMVVLLVVAISIVTTLTYLSYVNNSKKSEISEDTPSVDAENKDANAEVSHGDKEADTDQEDYDAAANKEEPESSDESGNVLAESESDTTVCDDENYHEDHNHVEGVEKSKDGKRRGIVYRMFKFILYIAILIFVLSLILTAIELAGYKIKDRLKKYHISWLLLPYKLAYSKT